MGKSKGGICEKVQSIWKDGVSLGRDSSRSECTEREWFWWDWNCMEGFERVLTWGLGSYLSTCMAKLAIKMMFRSVFCNVVTCGFWFTEYPHFKDSSAVVEYPPLYRKFWISIYWFLHCCFFYPAFHFIFQHETLMSQKQKKCSEM